MNCYKWIVFTTSDVLKHKNNCDNARTKQNLHTIINAIIFSFSSNLKETCSQAEAIHGRTLMFICGTMQVIKEMHFSFICGILFQKEQVLSFRCCSAEPFRLMHQQNLIKRSSDLLLWGNKFLFHITKPGNMLFNFIWRKISVALSFVV